MVSNHIVSRRATKPGSLLLAVFIAALSLWGQTTGPKVEVKIENVTRDEHGLKAAVSVKNIGNRTLLFGTDGNESLRSLDIQQHDANVGWESVGYCLDVPPACCYSLRPQEAVTNIIPLVDPKGRLCCGVCGKRKLRFLHGPIRAILYYGYASERDFQHRLHSKPILLNVTSSAVDLAK